MLKLDVTIAISRTEVLPDESFDVEVTLTNRDTAPMDVPSPTATCPFEFVLRSAKDERVIHVLDAEAAFEAHTGDPPPSREPEMETLAPGARSTYTYDLAKFYVTAVRPDMYKISALYRRGPDFVESAGVSLSIVSPKINALAEVSGPSEKNIGLVFANTEADGSLAICQRESYPLRPDCGILCRQVKLAPPQLVTGVACAIERYDNRGIRWFAWLDGDGLAAGIAQYRTLFAQIGPLPLGLKSPSLQSQGWQFSSESATFVALGMNTQGRVAFAAVPFPASDSNGVTPISLSLSTLPLHWASRCRVQDEKIQFDVVACEETSGRTRTVCQTVTPETGDASSVVTLAEREESLVALALEPVAGEEPAVADILLGPSGNDTRMTFLRLFLTGGPARGVWTFTAPRDPEGKIHPSDWTIAPKPFAVPVVLVKFGDKIMARRLDESSSWVTVATETSGARNLRLEVIGTGALWAIWIDPVTGIQYRPVRL